MTMPYFSGYNFKHHKMTVDEYLKEFPLDDLHGKPLLVVLNDRGSSITDVTGKTAKTLLEMRTKLAEKNIPTYPNIARASNAAAKMVDFYRKRKIVRETESL